MADTAENIANKVLSGTEGSLWINGDPIEEINKVETKIEGVFENIDFAGVYGEMNRYMGYKISGTLTLNKMHSRALGILGDAFTTGKFPDIEIIATVTNKQTDERESISLQGVQFTEFDFNFETKKPTQEAIPFKAISYKVLETLS